MTRSTIRAAVAGAVLLLATGADSATRALQLVVDTGAGHALSLELGDEAREKLRDTMVSGTIVGWGANGPLRGDIGRVRALDLGGAVLAGVVTTFPRDGTWARIGARMF